MHIIRLLRKLMRRTHETAKVVEGMPVTEPIHERNDERYTEHDHKCCKCGLTHVVRVTVEEDDLVFRYWIKN